MKQSLSTYEVNSDSNPDCFDNRLVWPVTKEGRQRLRVRLEERSTPWRFHLPWLLTPHALHYPAQPLAVRCSAPIILQHESPEIAAVEPSVCELTLQCTS